MDALVSGVRTEGRHPRCREGRNATIQISPFSIEELYTLRQFQIDFGASETSTVVVIDVLACTKRHHEYEPTPCVIDLFFAHHERGGGEKKSGSAGRTPPPVAFDLSSRASSRLRGIEGMPPAQQRRRVAKDEDLGGLGRAVAVIENRQSVPSRLQRQRHPKASARRGAPPCGGDGSSASRRGPAPGPRGSRPPRRPGPHG